MSSNTDKRHDLLIAVCVTVGLFLLVDVLMGQWLLSIAMGELPKDKFRAPHPVYHHTLIPNYDGIGYWGPGTYHVCTNGSAFKDRCDRKGITEKSFDIAFMGDSFTEGVGMPYEQTFVGMVAAKHPELKIANLGVVSYAPSIYLAKLRELYAQGYQFKKVIVFVDIGDVQDEALTYETVDGKVISKHEQLPPGGVARLRRIASRWLPLTGEAWNRVRASGVAITALLNARKQQSTPMPAAPAPVVTPHTTTLAASAQGDRGESTSAAPGTPVPPASASSSAESSGPADPSSPANPPSSSNPLRSANSITAVTPGLPPLKASETQPASPQSTAQADFASTKPSDAIKSVLFAPTVEASSIYDRNYSRSEWTYNTKSTRYGDDGVMGTVEKMRATMDELYRLVRDHGGELSVGVYPWPGQIKYDKEDSLQARIWGEFCATRCAHFYNAFPAFFDLVRQQGEHDVIFKYYMGGDMHFSENGNAVIAQVILNAGL